MAAGAGGEIIIALFLFAGFMPRLTRRVCLNASAFAKLAIKVARVNVFNALKTSKAYFRSAVISSFRARLEKKTRLKE